MRWGNIWVVGFAVITWVRCTQEGGAEREAPFVGDYIVQPRPERPEVGSSRHALHHSGSPHIVFLNFDGDDIQCSNWDDSSTNESAVACGWAAGTYPAFDHAGYGCSSRQECVENIVDYVRELWAPLNVAFVTERPSVGPYEMVMIGGTTGTSAAGVAMLDCDDWWPSNVSFAFSGGLGGLGECSQGFLATTISQELAHAYGVCHNGDCSGSVPSIMCPFASTCDADWGGGDLVDSCPCYSGYADPMDLLMDVLGPASIDDVDPWISIGSPQWGQTVPCDFTIEVDATDDRDVSRVVFVDNGEEVAEDTTPPYSFVAEDYPEGDHTFTVVVYDAAGNNASDTIELAVDCSLECTEGACCCGDFCCAQDCSCELAGVTGEPCAVGTDCQGGLCVSNPGQVEIGQICTAACEIADECPAGFTCQTEGDSSLCWPREGGVGRPCGSQDDCSEGLCVAGGEAEGFCTVECTMSDDDCPADFSCGEVGEAALCLPISAGVGDGDEGCGCDLGQRSAGLPPMRIVLLLIGLALALSTRRYL